MENVEMLHLCNMGCVRNTSWVNILAKSVPKCYDCTYIASVKPVCNDHLCDKIYYLWFIQ